MSRIQSFFDLIGNTAGLKTALDASVRMVQQAAAKINATKASLNVAVNNAASNQGAQTFVRRFGSSNGPDPLVNFIASSGANAAGALAIGKVAGSGLNLLNTGLSLRSAQRRGDINGELEAQGKFDSFLRGIPIAGEIGGGIRDLGNHLSGEQEALDNIKQQTVEQDKLVKAMQERAEKQRALNRLAEDGLRLLDDEAEKRKQLTSAGKDAIDARTTFEKIIRQQDEARGQFDLTPDQQQFRDAAGREVSRTSGAASAADRTLRTRVFEEDLERNRTEGEKARAESEQRIRASRRFRTDVAVNNLDQEREEREAGQAEAEQRGRDIRAGRTSTTRRFVDLADRRRDGEGETNIAELQARGQSGQAQVAQIQEALRRAIEDAKGDPVLESQANRRATADLKSLDRETRLQVAGTRAEAVSAQTTDLFGRFGGSIDDPNRETPKILRDRIATALDKIETNTRNPVANYGP